MNNSWNDYFIDGTDVLKNKFNIKNNDELIEKEKKIVLEKLALLDINPIKGNFDIKHLKDIHNFLFSDIYFFAGEFRNCPLAKPTQQFYDPSIFEDSLNKAFDELKQNSNEITDKRRYSYVLANAYYELMNIHPFREGNGRSVREFLKEFVIWKNKDLDKVYELDFSKINPDDFLRFVKFRYIYHSMLEEEFYKALIVKEKNINLL